SIHSNTSIDFADPKGDGRRWTKVWSAGHGVGSIQKSEPLADIARSLIDGHRAAIDKPAFAPPTRWARPPRLLPNHVDTTRRKTVHDPRIPEPDSSKQIKVLTRRASRQRRRSIGE